MKKIIMLVLVVAGLLATAWFVMNQTGEETVDMSVFENATTVTYSSAPEGPADTLVVAYAGEQALVNGEGLTDEVLTQVVSASGVKYQNEDGSVVLWNKGDEVTLYVNEAATFTGTDIVMTEEKAMSSTDAVMMQLTANTWVWTETVMSNGSATTPVDAEAFTLTFNTDSTMTGTTDCNNFSGGYMLGNTVLNMGPFAMTRMACQDSQEQEFMAMISTTTTVYFTENGDLTLLLPLDSGSIMFKKQVNPVAAKLTGDVWVWEEAVLGDDTTVTPDMPEAFTMTFAEDTNTVSITTDCNSMSGTYTLSGNNLQIGPNLAATMRLCEGSQEQAFTKLITQPLTVAEIEAEPLTLNLPLDGGQLIFQPK